MSWPGAENVQLVCDGLDMACVRFNAGTSEVYESTVERTFP